MFNIIANLLLRIIPMNLSWAHVVCLHFIIAYLNMYNNNKNITTFFKEKKKWDLLVIKTTYSSECPIKCNYK